MTAPSNLIPVFDGHNDTVLSLRSTGRDFFTRSTEGHLDFPRAKEGGLAGGIFAIFVSDPGDRPGNNEPGVISPSPELTQTFAEHYAIQELARLRRIVTASDGAARIVTTAAELRQCLTDGTFAIELHIEGAEPIDAGLDALEVFYAAGLRSIGPVWSRSNIFGHGVPFAFGQSPDTGPGLTDAGKDLVRACNRLGIMLDVSHLNEKGFWDLAAITDDPIVASHSNVHALASATRNLTAKQLDAIRDSNGLVGLNFHVAFLTGNATQTSDVPLSLMVDHVDAMVEAVGIDHVGLGSDFDGATMPVDLGDVTGLPRLIAALRDRGYDDEALAKIAHGNWVRVLEATWGA